MPGLHAAAHGLVDANECELCASYADPSAAIPVAEISMPPCGKPAHVPEFGATLVLASPVFGFRQRGPPLSI